MSKSIKRILIFNSIILAFVALGIWLHPIVLPSSTNPPLISITAIYLFFGIAALIIVTGIELLFDVMSDKVGYAFLVGIFLKLGFFTVLFLSKGILDKPLSTTDRLGLILPLFLFLIIEVAAVATRLKQAWDAEK